MAPRASSKSKKKVEEVVRTTTTTTTSVRQSVAPPPPPHLRPLYPTIAISDAFFALTNFYAAYSLWKVNSIVAALGFFIVGLAAGFGVLGFGVSSYYFATINSYFADQSAFVALPMVGLSSHPSFGLPQIASIFNGNSASSSSTILVVALTIIHTIVRGAFTEKQRDEIVKIPFNLICFIGPLAHVAFQKSDWQIAIALALIVFAGVGVGADRNRLFMGLFLRENVFHYLMGVATLILGSRLAL